MCCTRSGSSIGKEVDSYLGARSTHVGSEERNIFRQAFSWLFMNDHYYIKFLRLRFLPSNCFPHSKESRKILGSSRNLRRRFDCWQQCWRASPGFPGRSFNNKKNSPSPCASSSPPRAPHLKGIPAGASPGNPPGSLQSSTDPRSRRSRC